MTPPNTRPQPTSLHPNDAALQALAEARAASIAAQTAVDHLLQLEQLRNTPPQSRHHVLTAAQPIIVDRSRQRSASFGVYNPNPVVIYTSVGGSTPQPGKGALTIPPNSFVVLPLALQEVELGVDATDPDLAGGASAVIYLLRWQTVQAPFLGSAS